VNDMPRDERKRAYWRDLALASAMMVTGFVMSGLSLAEFVTYSPQMAQATPPLQSTPGAETRPSTPAEPVTTGARPSEIPPQPARPDADAQKAGAAPALPPAPAEKMAAPIKEK
jgi:hypothetical protein